MLDFAIAREASSPSRDIQPQPLDFIRPVMLYYLNTIMEYCIHDVEGQLNDIKEIITQEVSQSSFISPEKDVEILKDEAFFKGFSAGTVSTAASDSILTPSLDSSSIAKKNSEEKDSKVEEKDK